MMNLNMFRELQDPFSLAARKTHEALFKDCKLLETAASKKRIGALAWDLTGSKLVTGASDGILRVQTLSNYGGFRYTTRIHRAR